MNWWTHLATGPEHGGQDGAGDLLLKEASNLAGGLGKVVRNGDAATDAGCQTNAGLGPIFLALLGTASGSKAPAGGGRDLRPALGTADLGIRQQSSGG